MERNNFRLCFSYLSIRTPVVKEISGWFHVGMFTVWYKIFVFETVVADQTLEAEFFNCFVLFLRWLKIFSFVYCPACVCI